MAMRLEITDSSDKFIVFGRGVLHLSVLIETMRREGYELQIGQPQVIIKEIEGVKMEPIEELTIDLPKDVSGKAIEMVSIRKGEMIAMNYRVAPLDVRQKAMLAFAEKITKESAAIRESDRDALRAVGFNDRDIWDIANVAGFFNMSNRVASAVDMRPNDDYHAQYR